MKQIKQANVWWKWCVSLHVLRCFTRVRLFVTPWTVAFHASLSMGFPRQEYWSGLLFPSPGHIPDPRIEPTSLMSPALAKGFFHTISKWGGRNCAVPFFQINASRLHPNGLPRLPDLGEALWTQEPWQTLPNGQWWGIVTEWRRIRPCFRNLPIIPKDCGCSVSQSHLTLCSPMDCSKSGFPVLHHLPELAQTHVHWVSDAIQLSHPLLPPSPPAFNVSQDQGLFQWVSSSHQVAKVLVS